MEITVTTYTRGKQVTPQDLEDEDYTLVVDQANQFSFQMDDIEVAHSHVDFMSMASDRAAYRIKDKYDEDVLGYMAGFTKASGSWAARTTYPGTLADSTADSDELLAANKLYADDFTSGASSTAGIVMGVDGTFDATPLQILNRINRLMDTNSVPKEGRWVVIDPVFEEFLMDENSKLMNNDWGGNEDLMNGKIMAGKLRGFRIYRSNNLPYLGTGSGTVASTSSRDASNLGFIVAGHDSAVATASQINKTEKIRSTDTFADVVRGLHLYGRKILRPESLYRAGYNVNK